MTNAQALAMAPGQTIYVGYLVVNSDVLGTEFAADLSRAEVVRPLVTEGVDAGQIFVRFMSDDGILRMADGGVIPEDSFLTRVDAIENVRRELREHREACERFAMEVDGVLREELNREATP